ncbi:MAG: autotransporter adhesin family protein [Candidatus Bathyarchaeota archaeon]|nr:autotransporter adhesin family protein [Candidatus Termiticorpusculum sp.]MCL2868840.1 autotransporter adhesin family protein [Candidatus Termiticorpusculum sp.]
MNANIKSKFNSHSIHSRKAISFVSLLFMTILLVSPLVSVFTNVSPFASAAPDKVVGTANELIDAVANAPDGSSYTIALDMDITLTDTLEIPADKDITLVSDSDSKFFKLIGADGKSTITVMRDGELTLAGIIVVHEVNAIGTGVIVNGGGTLTMTSGEIFNNTATSAGGVRNWGTFKLSGGKIYNNTVTGSGGGVYNDGTFTLSGGEISGNTAKYGAGVYNNGESFKMTGGRISLNIATEGGGVYSDKDFTLSGGMIFNNTATSNGGGVYNYYNEFKMQGGEIANNTAALDGGGVYIHFANFTMTDGKISNNTANRNGGGIGMSNSACLEDIDISSSAAFSNNRASAAYDRAESDDELYRKHIGSKVTWTSPFEQGYNNYDISYTKGTQIDVDDGSKPTTSPTSTPTNTPRPPTPSDNGSKPESDGFDWRIVVIVLAIVIALLVAALIFYLPKREAKHIEEDLNDFTVV